MRGGAGGNGGGGNHWIRDSKRRRIYERDGWKCWACGRPVAGGRKLRIEGGTELLATLDHVLPRKRGGTNHESNLVTSCEDCNRLKGDGSAVEFAFSHLSTVDACDALVRLLLNVMAELPAARRAA
jgi:hypothetical protein